jgi:hypothetical protein
LGPGGVWPVLAGNLLAVAPPLAYLPFFPIPLALLLPTFALIATAADPCDDQPMTRAGLWALLLAAASSCTSNPVTPDLRVDRGVDLPVLRWNDARPDRQPWPEARPLELRVDQRVADLVPQAFCQDGTPIFHCSAQKPYVCNAAKLLEHKCSTCGCPGNEVCVPATEACQPVTVVLQPTADASASSAYPTTNYGAEQVAVSISGTGDKTIDVAALIQAWVDSPAVLHGLRLSATSGAVAFASRESGANGPTLTIIYR